MIKRTFTLLSLLLLGIAVGNAQGRLSASARLAMQQHKECAGTMLMGTPSMVRAFITVDDSGDMGALRSLGVNVQARFDHMVTATVPVGKLREVCALAGVRQVTVAQVAQVCNDSARADAHADAVMAGDQLSMPYDGSGVIVGIVDTGVDFNHINFCDEQGNSRVVAAYLPQDSTGISPVVDGDTLPGSHYDTPQQIAKLTTDDPQNSHCTHTLGTAAGSYTTNGWHGVAPGAKLVVCAMPTLYDTDIANSIKYIFDCANRLGMPAVINMSLASDDGPRDGTSPLCQVMDQLSGEGRIISLSAHNTGFAALHLPYSFASASDTLSTALDVYSTHYTTLSFWSSVGHHHQVALTLIDKTNSCEVLQMPFFTEIAPDSVLTLEIDSIEGWNEYLTGKLYFATAVEEGDRTHSLLMVRTKPYETKRYRLGLKVVSDTDPKFNVWASGGVFFRKLVEGQTSGTKAGTISDLATGDSPISVGAYITKQSYTLATGETFVSPRATPMHDIAYFSSWGPDQRGINRPDICAPGMVVISSASRYDTISSIISSTNLVPYEVVNGQLYPYGACYGTSMSAPVMTGTIALWMQAYPQLSPDDVREILDNSAVRDDIVAAGDKRYWGRGKLDTEAGLHYLLHKLNAADVNADGVVDVADINQIINLMLGISDDLLVKEWADINADGVVDVADVNELINKILGA